MSALGIIWMVASYVATYLKVFDAAWGCLVISHIYLIGHYILKDR